MGPSVDGLIQHFDGQRLTTLEGLFPRPRPHDCTAPDYVDMIYKGPQEIVLVATTTNSMVHYLAGSRNDIPVTANQTGRDLNSIGHVPGFGFVVGNSRGNIYRTADLATFSDLGDTGSGVNVFSFVPFPGGFLWGGWAGFIGQYLSDDQRFCLPPMQIAGTEADYVAKVGDWFVVGGYAAPTVTESSVTILKPSP
jgi:hypothetical protein